MLISRTFLSVGRNGGKIEVKEEEIKANLISAIIIYGLVHYSEVFLQPKPSYSTRLCLYYHLLSVH
jgi:hypothetical protein